MCLFECRDEETCVYVVGVNDSWNGTFKWVTVVGIVRHARSMSVYDIKHVEG